MGTALAGVSARTQGSAEPGVGLLGVELFARKLAARFDYGQKSSAINDQDGGFWRQID